MNHLPGYDAWLTHDPRDRDYGPCDTCGHDIEEHDQDGVCEMKGGSDPDHYECPCEEFIEGDKRP